MSAGNCAFHKADCSLAVVNSSLDQTVRMLLVEFENSLYTLSLPISKFTPTSPISSFTNIPLDNRSLSKSLIGDNDGIFSNFTVLVTVVLKPSGDFSKWSNSPQWLTNGELALLLVLTKLTFDKVQGFAVGKDYVDITLKPHKIVSQTCDFSYLSLVIRCYINAPIELEESYINNWDEPVESCVSDFTIHHYYNRKFLPWLREQELTFGLNVPWFYSKSRLLKEWAQSQFLYTDEFDTFYSILALHVSGQLIANDKTVVESSVSCNNFLKHVFCTLIITDWEHCPVEVLSASDLFEDQSDALTSEQRSMILSKVFSERKLTGFNKWCFLSTAFDPRSLALLNIPPKSPLLLAAKRCLQILSGKNKGKSLYERLRTVRSMYQHDIVSIISFKPPKDIVISNSQKKFKNIQQFTEYQSREYYLLPSMLVNEYIIQEVTAFKSDACILLYKHLYPYGLVLLFIKKTTNSTDTSSKLDTQKLYDQINSWVNETFNDLVASLTFSNDDAQLAKIYSIIRAPCKSKV